MGKEKQIEEMAKVIDEFTEPLSARDIHKAEFSERFANHLYNAGYRKQSEGEWRLGKSGCMYFCSDCDYVAHPREVDEWSYCPRCGARMKGGAE